MATLTSTITESISLNGADRGSTNTLTVASVTQVFHRIVTCPTGQDTTVATFASVADDSAVSGSLDVEDVKYIRVTNLDSTNPVNLSLQVDADENDTAADESATLLLAAGRSFVMGAPSDGVAVSDTNANLIDALHNLESILIDPLSNAVTVEVFIAS
jgi:hypothetical protein|tara:strand:+ start:650 stop:1123 length:474 start_codon:yes stop_codon:yes gene_type:complete